MIYHENSITIVPSSFDHDLSCYLDDDFPCNFGYYFPCHLDEDFPCNFGYDFPCHLAEDFPYNFGYNFLGHFEDPNCIICLFSGPLTTISLLI